MKLSKQWLLEWIDLPNIESKKLTEQLDQVGLEVAQVQHAAKDFSGIVVGYVLTTKPHPNADKLTLCEVDVGGEIPLNIICGASNVRPNLKVATATVGAVLPGDFKIKAAKLRGIESCGMLCSATELGLAETSKGIIELPADAPVGCDLRNYLQLDDEVIEIELTANRGDCASILGIAREVAAINNCKLKAVTANITATGGGFPVEVIAKQACSHYCGRVIRNINNQAITPIWLQEKLRRVGLRSINPVVDVTNYVMLELGQPLHAFDLAKLDSEIIVRYATANETLTLLDGKSISLDEHALVIADKTKPLALAGIMGGEESGVGITTSDLFLESAFFAPTQIMATARKYSLQTDSSYRFERGVDPQLQREALDYATALLLQIVGGDASDSVEVAANDQMPARAEIALSSAKLNAILGQEIAFNSVATLLASLGMQVKTTESGWLVKPPSWRFDITIAEDLVEEVARLYDYDNIIARPLVAELIAPTTNVFERYRLHDLMVDLGYHETITFSFTDPKLQAVLDSVNAPLMLANPISSELSAMRTSLWPGLVAAAKYNLARQQERIRLFEIGLCFQQTDADLQQPLMLAGITTGSVLPEQWGIKPQAVADFFTIKNDLLAVAKLLGYCGNVVLQPTGHSALHPRRSAQVFFADNFLGYVGELHPLVRQQLELPDSCCLFEINLTNINKNLDNKMQGFSKFPSVQRDLAIVVAKAVSWSKIKEIIVDSAGNLLYHIDLFDIYCGNELGDNNKSVAIHLVFQDKNRTLVDKEIEELLTKIILKLKQELNANLRG